MQEIKVNFIQHPLTEAEIKQACILSPSQLKWLENQLTQAMNERANLSYDHNLPITAFVQQEASLMGQITAFQFMLDSHQQVIADLQRDAE